MKSYKCPVCGKNDIPDYKHQDVVCPCCNTDLSIYHLVDNIEANGGKTKMWKWIALGLIAVVVVLSVGYFVFANQNGTQQDDYITQINSLKAQNNALEADNDSLRLQIESLSVEPPKDHFPYIVKKGDCLCLISKKFYGTEKQWKEIANDNGIDEKHTLIPGDTLKIRN